MPDGAAVIRPYSFDKSRRLLRNSQFQYTYRRGKSVADARLVLVAARTRGKTRVGFSVGKKVGNSVVRSRAKRLMRECCRQMYPLLATGYNFIFIARSAMKYASFAETNASMTALLERGGYLQEDLP